MAGRKRKPGNRHPGGKLVQERKRPDAGNARIVAEREWLSGERTAELTTTPLGIMFANEIVTQDQYDAGNRYVRLHRIALGRGPITAVDLDGLGLGTDASDGEEEWRIKAHDRWQAAVVALRQDTTRRRLTVVDSVCVHERMPRWMKPHHPSVRPSDATDADALMDGLDVLADLFGYTRRRARAA